MNSRSPKRKSRSPKRRRRSRSRSPRKQMGIHDTENPGSRHMIIVEEYNPNHRYDYHHSSEFESLKRQLLQTLNRRDSFNVLKEQLRNTLERRDKELQMQRFLESNPTIDFRKLDKILKKF